MTRFLGLGLVLFSAPVSAAPPGMWLPSQLPEPFEGHPLRKDFVLMSRVAKPWPGAVEGEEEEEE